MVVGVVAPTIERASYLLSSAVIEDDVVVLPLTPNVPRWRGRSFDAIFVDPDLWPLDERLAVQLAPYMYQRGGGFIVATPYAVNCCRAFGVADTVRVLSQPVEVYS